ncbi:MAG: hypothetical protein FWC40_04875 [Proteobacteria bacterium]|nr:hypothetical protein [Pseudomonadota bacterium]
MSLKLRYFLACFFAIAVFVPLFFGADAHAEDRFSAGGYFRIAARPDFQGGWSKLGLWNISGRLLNESQWAALEMRLQLIRQTPGTNEVWTSLHAKIEGGSVHGADLLNGSLGAFALTQLYVQAGNVLIEDVVWQLGTLDYHFGDLGLYDMKFAQIFYETVGVSGTWSHPLADIVVGFGDSGYLRKQKGYSPILTFGAAVRLRPVDGFELGLGGELFYEPSVKGSENAPHQTRFSASQGVSYASFFHEEVVRDFADTLASINLLETSFPRPTAVDALSYKLVGYVGFGKLGALKWNNLFVNFLLSHPESYYRETYNGQTFRIFTKEWTDERYQFNLGNEMNLEIVKDRFDLTWAGLFGYHFDKDDTISASERNRMIWSLVVRGQVYMTPTVHFLAETSFAQEKSLNGNLWRKSAGSIWANNGGVANIRGFEYGDLNLRNTWQGKTGFVINPGGTGIFSRPSLRLLYGVQYSNMHSAFQNSNVETQNLSNEFFGTDFSSIPDRHWHHVISIEAEAWF